MVKYKEYATLKEISENMESIVFKKEAMTGLMKSNQKKEE